jgi:hypothetical protein
MVYKGILWCEIQPPALRQENEWKDLEVFEVKKTCEVAFAFVNHWYDWVCRIRKEQNKIADKKYREKLKRENRKDT